MNLSNHSIVTRMLAIDRRFIFMLIALATLIPLLNPINLPIMISPEVRAVYDHMESLPEGSVFLLSMDFDPASKPEVYPQAIALLRHAFKKNLKVIGLTLLVTGTGMAEEAMATVAEELEKINGTDYAFLGWRPGASAVILSMGQDLVGTFPQDHYGIPIDELSVMHNVKTLRDVDYAVSLAAGFPGVDEWYIYGKDKYRFELGGGSTAVMAPGLYPRLRAGQINGLIGGLRGAAEYEKLLDQSGKATAGMDSQSATHFVIIVLVIICNVFYVISRRQKRT
ncbi:MAG: hypothetical protein CMH81_01560 [Nitrospiraceae bacterium]|nr:hypothetical protein [Nitrospiraceae bacterium]|tara:strand:+ start:4651 stop:5493 length:843 start_codon:yes stop_codon:yes gene_type:complete